MDAQAPNDDLAGKVLAVFDAWNRDDFEGCVAMAHPEVDFRPAVGGQLDGLEFRGHEGLRRFWDEWRDLWETVRVRVDQHEWLAGRLLLIGAVEARGRHSGVTVNAPLAWLIEFEDRRMRHIHAYMDAQAARDAAGGPA